MKKIAVRNLRLCTKDCLCLYVCPVGATDTENSIIDTDKCTGCGVCAALCPMGSISRKDPAEVTGVCIKCHACVRNCPTGAKYFDDEAFLSHKAMLERDYTRRAEDKLFL